MRHLLLYLLGVMSSSTANAAGQSFTPTSYTYPIHGVTLQNRTTGKSAVIYQCAGTDAACSVDLLDAAAVAAFFANVRSDSVEPGTYDQVYMEACAPGASGHTVSVTGSVSLEGVTYFTSAGAQPFSTSASEAGAVALIMMGCGGGAIVPAGFEVKTDETLKMTLLTTTKNLVFAQLGAASQGGCKSGTVASLCTNIPAVIPVVGDATAKAETFLISLATSDTVAAQASGQVVLFLDQNDKLIGGVCRRYYSATTLPGAPEVFDSGWSTWSTNGDGSVKFATDGRLAIDAFQRATHSGTMTTVSGSVTYQALKI